MSAFLFAMYPVLHAGWSMWWNYSLALDPILWPRTDLLSLPLHLPFSHVSACNFSSISSVCLQTILRETASLLFMFAQIPPTTTSRWPLYIAAAFLVALFLENTLYDPWFYDMWLFWRDFWRLLNISLLLLLPTIFYWVFWRNNVFLYFNFEDLLPCSAADKHCLSLRPTNSKLLICTYPITSRTDPMAVSQVRSTIEHGFSLWKVEELVVFAKEISNGTSASGRTRLLWFVTVLYDSVGQALNLPALWY